jgi:hypothetical protein
MTSSLNEQRADWGSKVLEKRYLLILQVGEPKELKPLEDIELIVATPHLEEESRLTTLAINVGSHTQTPRSSVSIHRSQTKETLTVNVLEEFNLTLRGTTAGMF